MTSPLVAVCRFIRGAIILRYTYEHTHALKNSKTHTPLVAVLFRTWRNNPHVPAGTCTQDFVRMHTFKRKHCTPRYATHHYIRRAACTLTTQTLAHARTTTHASTSHIYTNARTHFTLLLLTLLIFFSLFLVLYFSAPESDRYHHADAEHNRPAGIAAKRIGEKISWKKKTKNYFEKNREINYVFLCFLISCCIFFSHLFVMLILFRCVLLTSSFSLLLAAATPDWVLCCEELGQSGARTSSPDLETRRGHFQALFRNEAIRCVRA